MTSQIDFLGDPQSTTGVKGRYKGWVDGDYVIMEAVDGSQRYEWHRSVLSEVILVREGEE